MVAMGNKGDVTVCVSEEGVFEYVGDRTWSGSGGANSSWVLDSMSTSYIYPRRD
jgi:hypothetical protein